MMNRWMPYLSLHPAGKGVAKTLTNVDGCSSAAVDNAHDRHAEAAAICIDACIQQECLLACPLESHGGT